MKKPAVSVRPCEDALLQAERTLWTDGLEYYHVLQQRAPSGTGVVRHTVLLLLRSGHYSLIHNFQALAGRQGLTLGAEGLLAAPPRYPVLSRDGRAHLESAAARAREEPAALQGQGLRAVAVVELLLGGLEGREALPAVSGGPVLQLLPPGHADGPSSASPGEVVVGQLEKVVDGVVLVAVPLVVREPQPQLLGWHVAAAADSDVAGRGRDGLTRWLLLRYVDRRGGRAVDLEVRVARQGSELCRAVSRGAPATSRPRRPRPSPWSFTTGAATTSTSCCATSPRRALLSAGHRAKSSARTATTRAPRAIKKEASPRGPCPWPRLRQRPRLQAAIKQGDYSHLCLRVLCKSGEKCLQMSWGPLRFVDSMNVFPTSLASMIDDLRACTHKHLPSPPQRRPLKQRRTHCELEQAWDCILRKLPMPFEHFCGAEAWEMPAVWEQHCYDSVLAGKAVSAEDRRLAVNTANVMGWETFREFHDCYLHTDVLALADVMESYRHSFRAQSGLDPIHYVTLLGAAWDAMLRHSARETPIHLITDEQAYKDVRASVMGGLSCIFQPFAQTNNPELGEEDYNPEEPVSWISYLDFNAMYPAAMTLPMPNGPCEAVALPEDNAARLSWLHKTCLLSLGSPTPRLLVVDYDFPRSCMTTWTGLPPRA